MTELGDLRPRVVAALRGRLPDARVGEVTPLPGGASSLTFAARLTAAGPERVVVKVAPPGLPPVRNRDVLRQARALLALANAPGVAVPEVLGQNPGDPPEVPPLFVMTFVDGESVEPFTEPDPARLPDPAVVAARAERAAAMLAALHAVDIAREDMAAERVWTPEAEVHRWARTFEALDDDLRPDTAMLCRDRLLGELPEPAPAALLHGDWRLGNMLCRGCEVAAVIDWEIWSLGDPRVDLAWLMLLADPGRPQNLRSGCGMPPADALAGRYAEAAGGRRPADLNWFGALVRYKQAAAAGFIAKNNRRQAQPDPATERHGNFGAALLDDALALLETRR